MMHQTYDTTVHQRGLDGNTPKNVGGTMQTEPSVLYWVTGVEERGWEYGNNHHTYVTEYPFGMGMKNGPEYYVSDHTYTYPSFQKLVRDVSEMTGRFGVVVDVTLRGEPNPVVIKKIEQVGDRDYILTFTTHRWGNSTDHDVRYTLKDCNHFAHASNRFKKRVRELCVTLGVTVDFMQHSQYEEVDTRPQAVAPKPVVTNVFGEPALYTVVAMFGNQKIGEQIGQNYDAFEAMRQAQSVYANLSAVFPNVKVWVNDTAKNSLSGGSFTISDKGITLI